MLLENPFETNKNPQIIKPSVFVKTPPIKYVPKSAPSLPAQPVPPTSPSELLKKEPENIPSALRTHVSKKVDKKKSQIKEIYTSPKESVTLDKIRNWAAVQMVKVLLGVPVLPGN